MPQLGGPHPSRISPSGRRSPTTTIGATTLSDPDAGTLRNGAADALRLTISRRIVKGIVRRVKSIVSVPSRARGLKHNIYDGIESLSRESMYGRKALGNVMEPSAF